MTIMFTNLWIICYLPVENMWNIFFSHTVLTRYPHYYFKYYRQVISFFNKLTGSYFSTAPDLMNAHFEKPVGNCSSSNMFFRNFIKKQLSSMFIIVCPHALVNILWSLVWTVVYKTKNPQWSLKETMIHPQVVHMCFLFYFTKLWML